VTSGPRKELIAKDPFLRATSDVVTDMKLCPAIDLVGVGH